MLNQRGKLTMTLDNVQARAFLVKGAELYGYLNGLFGRDSYGVKTIINIFSDHLVVKDEDGITMVSLKIDGKRFSWSEIVKASNDSLAEMEDMEERDE